LHLCQHFPNAPLPRHPLFGHSGSRMVQTCWVARFMRYPELTGRMRVRWHLRRCTLGLVQQFVGHVVPACPSLHHLNCPISFPTKSFVRGLCFWVARRARGEWEKVLE
jgi:hypothetical protein